MGNSIPIIKISKFYFIISKTDLNIFKKKLKTYQQLLCRPLSVSSSGAFISCESAIEAMNMVLNSSSSLHRADTRPLLSISGTSHLVSSGQSQTALSDPNQRMTTSSTQVPQRSPFAIQQLLGLSNSNNSTNNSANIDGTTSSNSTISSNASITASSVLPTTASSSSLCISNLVTANSNSLPSSQLQHAVQSANYFHSHGVSRTPPTTHPHAHHHHPSLLSPHSAAATAHCFSASESSAAANAARLAYFNSPAAAAFMSASMHAGLHPSSSVPGNACITGPSVTGPISMFHSFNTDSTISPRPETGNACGSGKSLFV